MYCFHPKCLQASYHIHKRIVPWRVRRLPGRGGPGRRRPRRGRVGRPAGRAAGRAAGRPARRPAGDHVPLGRPVAVLLLRLRLPLSGVGRPGGGGHEHHGGRGGRVTRAPQRGGEGVAGGNSI